MFLVEFFARRPILVHLTFLILILWGTHRILEAPVDVYPDLPLYEVTIATTWAGAGADEIERLVTDPIEEELEQLTDVNRIDSWSQAGLSFIDIRFNQWISEDRMREHLADVRARVDQVEDLPPDADEPIVTYLTVDEVWPVLYVGVLDDVGDRREQVQAISRRLERRLEALPGVRRVDPFFQQERWLVAEVHRLLLERHDLTLGEVIEAVMAEAEDAPAGPLRREGEATTETTAVSAAGAIEGAASLGNRIVRRLSGGGHVALRDVATVEDDFEDEQVRVRVNGQTCAALTIVKEHDANAMTVVDAVERELERFEQSEMPPTFSLTTTSDTTQIIRSRLRVLGLNLAQGTLIVLLTLMFILGTRPALLAIIGIPFSFIAAFTVLSWWGVTINALTMFSLVLVSGMVVDDAIIVLENLYRHFQRGKRGVNAVMAAVEEVHWPVVAAIATSIAAFIPLLIMPGVTGAFFAIIPKTVIAVLVASLVECLFILPGHFLEFGTSRRVRLGMETTSPFHRMRERIDRWMQDRANGTANLAGWLLPRRWWVSGFALAILMICFGAGSHLRQVLWPSDFQVFIVRVNSPAGSNLDQTAELMGAVERILERFRDGTEESHGEGTPGWGLVKSHISTIGRSISSDNTTMEQDPVVAMTIVELTDRGAEDPDRSVDLIREQVLEHLEANPDIPHALVDVTVPQDGPPTGKPVAARIFCGDYAEGRVVAERIRSALYAMPGVRGIDINLRPGLRSAELRLNELLAGAHDLTFAQVARELQFANFGAQVGRWFDEREGERVEVWVRLAEEDRDTLADLAQVPVRAPDGALLELRDVAAFDIEPELASRYRRDGRRCVMVTAEVDENITTSIEANQELERRMGEFTEGMPSVHVVLGGEFEESAKSLASLKVSFLIALLLIFTILAVQFNSGLQPLIVASAIPFAFAGVMLGMFLCDHLTMWLLGRGLFPFTYVTGVALVGLAGVVVNDSLVLVDFINQAKRQGESLHDSVLHGVRVRFRPIILTTLTTVGGLSPMALGTGGYSVIWSPFAAALIFGMISSTVLNLYLVPCLYLMAEDALALWRRLFPVPEDPHVWTGAVRE